jgi:hypothetical protein
MLKFNASQMRTMLRTNLVQSESKLADMVRQICFLGEQEWPADKLLEHTRRGLDHAIGNDLSTQEDIVGFLVLRHQFGERFDEFPAVRKFFARADLPPDNRIQLLMLTLPLAIWDVVKRRTPPGPSTPVRLGDRA